MTDIPLLEIDSNKVSLNEIWVQPQKDPYPGGHSFNLQVPIEYVGQWKDKLSSTTSINLAAMALKMVKWEFSNWPREKCDKDVPARFVLNKVTEVEISELGLVISGICSSFVRRDAIGPESA